MIFASFTAVVDHKKFPVSTNICWEGSAGVGGGCPRQSSHPGPAAGFVVRGGDVWGSDESEVRPYGREGRRRREGAEKDWDRKGRQGDDFRRALLVRK